MNTRIAFFGAARKESRERLASFARRVFGFSEDEAEKFAAAVPPELVLVALDDKEREKMARTFTSLGIEAQFSPMTIAHAPCALHAKLATTELCPRCKSERACRACLVLSPQGACAKCTRKLNFRTRFRRVRIGLLLAVFGAVALTAWLEKRRITSWKRPLVVRIHPIAGEAHPQVEEYIAAVNDASYDDLGPFFAREAARYGVESKTPVQIYAGAPIPEPPPPPPDPEDRSMASIAVWSLHLRWWTFRAVQKYDLDSADVRMFVIYHRPGAQALEHSTGLERVRVGVAHLYAGALDEAANDVVIAHELLHIVGASDEYDESGKPIFPGGYAEPERIPLYPQEKAEIMAGRIALSEAESRVAHDLELCVVGPKTAREIGWAR